MPNPTSKLNLVINGTTTQLDIHDSNAVDLTSNQTVAGDKEFTGTTTAHDLIPSATDTYNFGSPSYQWNNAYIKSLTINGVACGDILTHNVSEFVDVSSNQTIGGIKTFSSGGCVFFKQIKINHNLEYGKNNPPSQSAYHNLMFTDASGWWGSYIENVTDTSGNSTLAFYVRNTNDIQSRVYLKSDINGSFSMYPLFNNVWDLGTSTNKWKSFNGINPGALSLPSTTGLINVASSITSLDGTTINTFTPQVDGWLLINGTGPAKDGFIYVTQGRIGIMSASNASMSRCVALIPVVAGVEASVTCKLNTLTWANIVPCQGNV